MEYKPYTLRALLKGGFENEPVEVRGITRGVSTDSVGGISGVLQSGSDFVLFGAIPFHKDNSHLELFRASSEANVEVSVRGIYSSDSFDKRPAIGIHDIRLGEITACFKSE